MPCIAKVLFGIHTMRSLSTRRFLKVKKNLELGDLWWHIIKLPQQI